MFNGPDKFPAMMAAGLSVILVFGFILLLLAGWQDNRRKK
jgi:hypothetical protein